jgi:cytoskeleton-associated protein 5
VILQPLVEKAKTEVAARQPAPAPKPAAAGPTIVKPVTSASVAAKKNIYADSEESMDDPPPPLASKKEPVKAGAASKDAAATSKSTKPGAAAPTSASAIASKKKGADEEDFGPILQVSNKSKRMEEEKGLKTLKWNFESPRPEFLNQLRLQMEAANFSRSLLSNMFQEDFKFHIKALDALQRAIDDCQEATVTNLDLILRWLTLRFFETNPTVILKAIDYMAALFAMLQAKNCHLVDYEMNAFIPYFIGKVNTKYLI